MKFLKTFFIIAIVFSIGCTTTKTKKEQVSNETIEPIVLDLDNDGLIVGINKDDLHYIFKLKSKEPKWKDLGPSYFFLLDEDTAIQVLTLNFGKNKKLPDNINEIEVSKDNMKYEIDYQEKRIGLKLKSKSEIIQLKRQKALYWKVEFPKEHGGTQLYLSLIKKNSYLIGFHSPIINNNEKILKKLFIDTANSIEIIDTPITKKFMFDYSNKK